MTEKSRRAIASSAAKRSWFLKGWVNLTKDGKELHSLIGDKKFYYLSVDFTAPDESKVQFYFYVPQDGVMKSEETGDPPDKEGRVVKRFWIYENTMIWQDILRPVKLAQIDAADRELPAKLTYRDFSGGMDVREIPEQIGAKAIPAS